MTERMRRNMLETPDILPEVIRALQNAKLNLIRQAQHADHNRQGPHYSYHMGRQYAYEEAISEIDFILKLATGKTINTRKLREVKFIPPENKKFEDML